MNQILLHLYLQRYLSKMIYSQFTEIIRKRWETGDNVCADGHHNDNDPAKYSCITDKIINFYLVQTIFVR